MKVVRYYMNCFTAISNPHLLVQTLESLLRVDSQHVGRHGGHMLDQAHRTHVAMAAAWFALVLQSNSKRVAVLKKWNSYLHTKALLLTLPSKAMLPGGMASWGPRTMGVSSASDTEMSMF